MYVDITSNRCKYGGQKYILFTKLLLREHQDRHVLRETTRRFET